MPRLIDAYKIKCDRDAFDTYADYIKAFDAINEAPTVDAVPVRHGKWIDDGFYADGHGHHCYHCSKCGEGVIDTDTPWYKFCPNCGARMVENDFEH